MINNDNNKTIASYNRSPI